jgi:hypothetical protein
MAQRWREESFHRLISGRDQKWRTEPAEVRARTAGRLGHERKDCAAFLDARDTTCAVLNMRFGRKSSADRRISALLSLHAF